MTKWGGHGNKIQLSDKGEVLLTFAASVISIRVIYRDALDYIVPTR
jgi:hypothetical protein